ncbi:macro domain-containing protein [Ochrobactrum sp. EDr1-4]|uniref:macro domain-containing protein n=1 Tax=Ochrobactrum sp. EDr1-4 TaxID=3368622 RepID=UPI003B9E92F1
MSIREIKGNIFTTKAQTIVNTVNCVGVMGAGIALEFRLRLPNMYDRYVELCKDRKLKPGILWLYKSARPQVLNFPTKVDWKYPSKVEYLEKGLQKFVATYKEKNITSIAFPLLGADKGGLAPEISRNLLKQYLLPLEDLDVEIYEYDPEAGDDLYDKLANFVRAKGIVELSTLTGITKARLDILINAIVDGKTCQISQLGRLPGIGPATLEKLFAINFLQGTESEQRSFFAD